MAAFNRVVLVGRLTRDVESRSFANGGLCSKFGFAVTNRKKNSQTGQWEDDPMFIDCEAFNRGDNGKLADHVRDYCRKGSQILIEGRLHLDTWQDKASGANRQKHKIVVESMQLLDPKPQGQSAPANNAPPSDGPGDAPPVNEDIPFAFLLAMAASVVGAFV